MQEVAHLVTASTPTMEDSSSSTGPPGDGPPQPGGAADAPAPPPVDSEWRQRVLRDWSDREVLLGLSIVFSTRPHLCADVSALADIFAPPPVTPPPEAHWAPVLPIVPPEVWLTGHAQTSDQQAFRDAFVSSFNTSMGREEFITLLYEYFGRALRPDKSLLLTEHLISVLWQSFTKLVARAQLPPPGTPPTPVLPVVPPEIWLRGHAQALDKPAFRDAFVNSIGTSMGREDFLKSLRGYFGEALRPDGSLLLDERVVSVLFQSWVKLSGKPKRNRLRNRKAM